MSENNHTPFWAIIERRDGSHTQAIIYWVDASGFDSENLLCESEEDLHQLLAHNVRFEHIDDPSSESRFHGIVSRFLENDIDSLISGVAKKLCDDLHSSTNWCNLKAVELVRRLELPGEIVACKYGIKVWKLSIPVVTLGNMG